MAGRELVGWDEILGPHSVGAASEIEQLLAQASGYGVGAALATVAHPLAGGFRGAPLMMPVSPQAIQQAAAAGGHYIQDRGYTKSRQYPIGFDSGSTLIAAGASQNVTNRPQALFRPERLVVPSDLAGDFTVDDVKVGNVSQLVASGSLPARGFQEDAMGVMLKGDTCQPAIDLVIAVTNIAGAGRRFRAMIVGAAAQ